VKNRENRICEGKMSVYQCIIGEGEISFLAGKEYRFEPKYKPPGEGGAKLFEIKKKTNWLST
jgi:hypothetical protein